MQSHRESAMSSSKPQPQAVTVYCYYTYLAKGEKIVPVHSTRPATLDLIESLAAVPMLESGREADPSEVCDLGFLRSASSCAHASHAS
jgi:hypothetical protein